MHYLTRPQIHWLTHILPHSFTISSPQYLIYSLIISFSHSLHLLTSYFTNSPPYCPHPLILLYFPTHAVSLSLVTRSSFRVASNVRERSEDCIQSVCCRFAIVFNPYKNDTILRYNISLFNLMYVNDFIPMFRIIMTNCSFLIFFVVVSIYSPTSYHQQQASGPDHPGGMTGRRILRIFSDYDRDDFERKRSSAINSNAINARKKILWKFYATFLPVVVIFTFTLSAQ